MYKILMLLVLACALTITPASNAAIALPSQQEQAMLARINQARAAHGLGALRFEGRLQRAARWMSQDMIAHERFSHTDSVGRDPFKRLDHFGYRGRSVRGENIAAGNTEVARTYRQWWNSPPHRSNMLSSRYKYIGIARVCGSDSEYGCYWTTEFGGHWTMGFS